MLQSSFKQHIEERLSELTQQTIKITAVAQSGGGCINDTYHIQSNNKNWFLKLNDIRFADMFAAEADGLTSLSLAAEFVVPKPLFHGVFQQTCYLLMEYISLSNMTNETQFAKALSSMHSIQQHDFGYHRNNYIGTTVQSNRTHKRWFDFFMQERLEHQLKLLDQHGKAEYLLKLWPEFIHACEILFANHNPPASLLHGDLWQGNISQSGAQCCIYDPACYYGDHEADLAMLELFGQPSQQFYWVYNKRLSERPGLELRKRWYNLYHVMNHANLFSGGYLNQARRMIESIISAINR